MNSLKDLDVNEKKVLIRVDFNVPLSDDLKITDDTRMRAHIPSIKLIIEKGGIPVIMSHLGRPKGEVKKNLSLRNLVPHLAKLADAEVLFVDDCIGEKVAKLINTASKGQIVLLENLRFYDEETSGNLDFAKALSINGDVYVNDAFGTAHRAHASTATIAQFFEGKRAFGLVMEKEIVNVEKALGGDGKPVTAIVGGAKVSSKIGILESLLGKIDNLIIGGGMAFTFIKAKGGEVGNSLIEDDHLQTALDIMHKAKAADVNIYLPLDTINADTFSNDANTNKSLSSSIPEGYMGLDVGEKTLKELHEVITRSKTVIWNGPMGVFEFSNFENGTKKVGEAIAEATENGAFSLVGGGDSVAAIKQFNMTDKVSYVSTGGGAMLEFLEGKELPGIKAIKG